MMEAMPYVDILCGNETVSCRFDRVFFSPFGLSKWLSAPRKRVVCFITTLKS